MQRNIFGAILLLLSHFSLCQSINPNDVQKVIRYVEAQRKITVQNPDANEYEFFKYGIQNRLSQRLETSKTDSSRYFQALINLENHDYVLAEKNIESITSSDLKNRLRARLFVKVQRFDSALYHFGLLESYKVDYEYFYSLLKKGKESRADSIVLSLKLEGGAKHKFYSALLRLYQNRLAESLMLFEAYLKIVPSDYEARYWYAYTLWSERKPTNRRKITNQLHLATFINKKHYPSYRLLRFIKGKNSKLDDSDFKGLYDSISIENVDSVEHKLFELRQKDSTDNRISRGFTYVFDFKRTDYLKPDQATPFLKIDQSPTNILKTVLKIQEQAPSSLIRFIDHIEPEFSDVIDLSFQGLDKRISYDRDYSELDLFQNYPGTYYSNELIPKEEIQSAINQSQNAILSQSIKEIYHHALSYEERAEVRKYYLKYQNSSTLAPWFLGFDEVQFLHNLISSHFNLNQSLFDISPVFSDLEILESFPDLCDLMNSLFDLKSSAPDYNSNKIELMLHKVHQLLDSGYMEQAGEITAQALKIQPTYSPSLLSCSKIKFKENEYDSAISYCLDALKHDLEYSEAYLMLSKISTEMNPDSLVRAENYLNTAVSIEADPAKGLELSIALFNFHLEKGNYVEALKISELYFEPLFKVSGNLYKKRDPKYLSLWLKGILGYGEESLYMLQEMARKSPFDERINLRYTDALNVDQDYAQAARHLEGALRRLSSYDMLSAKYMLTTAKNYLKLGDSITAYYAVEPILEGIVQDESLDSVLYARVLVGIGKIEEGREIFNRQTKPSSVFDQSNYLMNQGYMAWYSGDPETAKKLFVRSLSINPYNLISRNELIKRSNKKRASELVQESLTLDLPPGEYYLEKIYEKLNLKEY
ncbi:MAG: tetratricopeptide repeat protein [Bacteroidota bacterium]